PPAALASVRRICGLHAAAVRRFPDGMPFVNELSTNRHYRKICYYESGGFACLSYFITFLVGA
ncbi:MAG: hypothetical protein LUH46_08945, partial [Alistipes sp.]|nr:hypothetical protein [Alistipes sp.]